MGQFSYVDHTGSGPTSFTLKRQKQSNPLLSPKIGDEMVFDPSSIQDARQKVLRSITQRRGQQAFRDTLISPYDGRCAISGCSILDVLEAAHICPYLGPETNRVMNGLLLRADIHTLFDCGLIAIDTKNMTVLVAPTLHDSEYKAFLGKKLLMPHLPGRPSIEALDAHRKFSEL